MLSTDQRRQTLEELLERVQRNRSRLGPPTDGEATAPPADAAAPPAPRPVPEPYIETIELDAEIAEVELEDEPIELDMSEDADDTAMVIDLTSNDEFGDVETVISPMPPPASETPLPVVDATAAPDETLIDDEPEIEVAYGTEEALALQAELGFGDDNYSSDITSPSDQLTLLDIQTGADIQGQSGAMIESDDLPAPASAEADLDEPAVQSKRPSELPLAEPLQESDDLPAAKTEELAAQVDEPSPKHLIEFSFDDEIAEPSDTQTPVPLAEPASDVTVEVLATAEAATPVPVAEAKAEPAVESDLEIVPEAQGEPVAPSPQAISGSKPQARADVAQITGAPPASHISSFGDLMRAALAVGRK